MTKAKPSKFQAQTTHLSLKKKKGRLGQLVLFKPKHWMSRHDSVPITKESRVNFLHSDLADSDFIVW